MENMKILIVDDELLLPELIKEWLTEKGYSYQLDTCDSAREAVKKIEDNWYDLVITDMALRDRMIGGCSVIKASRAKGMFTVLTTGGVACPDVCNPNMSILKPYGIEALELALKRMDEYYEKAV